PRRPCPTVSAASPVAAQAIPPRARGDRAGVMSRSAAYIVRAAIGRVRKRSPATVAAAGAAGVARKGSRSPTAVAAANSPVAGDQVVSRPSPAPPHESAALRQRSAALVEAPV